MVSLISSVSELKRASSEVVCHREIFNPFVSDGKRASDAVELTIFSNGFRPLTAGLAVKRCQMAAKWLAASICHINVCPRNNQCQMSEKSENEPNSCLDFV